MQLKNNATAVGAAVLCMIVAGLGAFGVIDPPAIVSDAFGTVVDALGAVLTAVLPLVAPLFAIVLGWRLAKRFLHV